MTLSKFQKVAKAAVVVIFLVFFAFVNYTIGKAAANTNGDKVKGVTTRNVEKDLIEKPLPYADIQRNEIIPSHVELCSNSSVGFEVAYPSDWFTTYNVEEQKCTFFAPYSFVVPQFIDNDFVPISIEALKPDDWLNSLSFYENPNDFYNVVSTENIDINARLVKKIVLKTTGEGSRLRGFTAIHYLVFDSEKPMRICYVQLEETEDVENISTTLEDIVRSLKYF